MAVKPKANTASWSMLQTDPTRWASQILCPHGMSTEGIWLLAPTEDDRNFLPLADASFANHQARYPDCDCTLSVDWTPTYVPPPPDPVPAPVDNPPSVDPRAGTASYAYTSYSPTRQGSEVRCPHGWHPAGVWTNGFPPNRVQLQAESYQNHQRQFACGCQFVGGATVTGTVNLQPANAVPKGGTVAIPQTLPGSLPPPFVYDARGRLSVSKATDINSLSATFYLSRGVAQGAPGSGLLRVVTPSATANLTAPIALTVPLVDVGGRATATFAWSGTVPADTSFELDYQNGSQQVQDEQGGSMSVTVPA